MSILNNFAQAGRAMQGSMRLYYMGQANQRANEQHQQQTEMRDMQMQQEQMKMDRQQQIEDLRQKRLDAQTPEEIQALEKRYAVMDPEGYQKYLSALNTKNKNHLNQLEMMGRVSTSYTTLIEQAKNDPQKQQAIWSKLVSQLNLNDAPKDYKEAVNSGYYQTFKDQSDMSMHALKRKRLELEGSKFKETKRHNKAMEGIYQDRNKRLGSSGGKARAIEDTVNFIQRANKESGFNISKKEALDIYYQRKKLSKEEFKRKILLGEIRFGGLSSINKKTEKQVDDFVERVYKKEKSSATEIPKTTKTNNTNIPTIKTQAEYDALPVGTEFIDSDDGKKYKKK